LRPEHLVVVCGTGTEVGKTWVAARKPAQSFDLDAEGVRLGGSTDAERLGAASGELPDYVCPTWRSYHLAMAPPMAAQALGLPAFTVADLVDELAWPDEQVTLGLVETAGGVGSPQAEDGDAVDLVAALEPDLVVLVADAGLGTINAVRLSLTALAGSAALPEAIVVLDRFDGRHDLHRRNREWLSDRDGSRVLVFPGDERALADFVLGSCSRG
jgi:dethiobiotin synthetase